MLFRRAWTRFDTAIVVAWISNVEGYSLGQQPGAGRIASDHSLGNHGHGGGEWCRPAFEVRWMWGDATIIGHWVAELDPLRWSRWESSDQLVREFEQYADSSRPVEVQTRTVKHRGEAETTIFANASEAIRRFIGKARRGTSGEAQAPKRRAGNAGALRRSSSASELPEGSGGAASTSPWAFHPEVAATLAHMAQATYRHNQTKLHDWTCRNCQDSGLSIEPGSVNSFSADSCDLYGFTAKLLGPAAFAQKCVLALRGTAALSNFWHDFDELQTAVPKSWGCQGCYVHRGFLEYWHDLKGGVLESLEASGCMNAAVYITGHSMGGALATLAAWSLAHVHGIRLAGVYTYQSPRVGNAEFAKAWEASVAKAAPSFRVNTDADPVTLLPCWWGSYTHVPYEVLYKEDGSFSLASGGEGPCSEATTIAGLAGSWSQHCSPAYFQHFCTVAR